MEDLGDGRFKVTITLDVVASGDAFLEKLKETLPSAEFDEQPKTITVIVAPPPPLSPPVPHSRGGSRNEKNEGKRKKAPQITPDLI